MTLAGRHPGPFLPRRFSGGCRWRAECENLLRRVSLLLLAGFLLSLAAPAVSVANMLWLDRGLSYSVTSEGMRSHAPGIVYTLRTGPGGHGVAARVEVGVPLRSFGGERVHQESTPAGLVPIRSSASTARGFARTLAHARPRPLPLAINAAAWTAVATACWCGAGVVRGGIRARRCGRDDRCVSCGYDAGPLGACPECGRAPASPDEPGISRPARRLRRSARGPIR